MAKTIKILTILFLTFSLIMVSSFTFAKFNPDDYKPDEIKDDTGDLTNITGKVLTYIRFVGVTLATIILTIIGLKYIFGSAEEKASYKENILLYVAGCILLMASTIIPSLVYNAANG